MSTQPNVPLLPASSDRKGCLRLCRRPAGTSSGCSWCRCSSSAWPCSSGWGSVGWPAVRGLRGLAPGAGECQPDVRWRAANDLAQVLQRNPQLASDPEFALKLAEKFQQALTDYTQSEQDFRLQQEKLSLVGNERASATGCGPRTLRPLPGRLPGQRAVPARRRLLCDVARTGRGAHVKSPALSAAGRSGPWPTSATGRQRFHQLPPGCQRSSSRPAPPQRRAAPATAAAGPGIAIEHLDPQQPLGVTDALRRLRPADDPFLREIVAFALGFWDESPVKAALAEQTLRLARDNGHGERIEIEVPNEWRRREVPPEE